MSRIDYARAFSSPGIRRKKESRTPKRPGTTAGNPRATSHERLTGQERRRRSSAYTGAGGGDGLAGKRKARAWYPSRQCIATAPLPGAPFACQVGTISLRPAVAPVRTGERPAYPRPSCTYTNGRGRSRSCAKPAMRRTGGEHTIPVRRGVAHVPPGIRLEPRVAGAEELIPSHR